MFVLHCVFWTILWFSLQWTEEYFCINYPRACTNFFKDLQGPRIRAILWRLPSSFGRHFLLFYEQDEDFQQFCLPFQTNGHPLLLCYVHLWCCFHRKEHTFFYPRCSLHQELRPARFPAFSQADPHPPSWLQRSKHGKVAWGSRVNMGSKIRGVLPERTFLFSQQCDEARTIYTLFSKSELWRSLRSQHLNISWLDATLLQGRTQRGISCL